MTKFNLLHISDLHWGSREDGWDTIQEALVDDIQRFFGSFFDGWDLVLFTGDLVCTGTGFKDFQERFLERFLASIGGGSRVPLLVVPGNQTPRQPPLRVKARVAPPVSARQQLAAVVAHSSGFETISGELAFPHHTLLASLRARTQRLPCALSSSPGRRSVLGRDN